MSEVWQCPLGKECKSSTRVAPGSMAYSCSAGGGRRRLFALPAFRTALGKCCVPMSRRGSETEQAVKLAGCDGLGRSGWWCSFHLDLLGRCGGALCCAVCCSHSPTGGGGGCQGTLCQTQAFLIPGFGRQHRLVCEPLSTQGTSSWWSHHPRSRAVEILHWDRWFRVARGVGWWLYSPCHIRHKKVVGGNQFLRCQH